MSNYAEFPDTVKDMLSDMRKVRQLEARIARALELLQPWIDDLAEFPASAFVEGMECQDLRAIHAAIATPTPEEAE
jgi:hypothetical protein